jgi:exosortase
MIAANEDRERQMSTVGVLTPPETAARPQADTLRLQRMIAWIVLAELVLLYAPTMRWLFERWTMSVWHHAHGLLIPPVVAYFVREELRSRAHLPRESSAWGFALLIPALVLHVLDTSMMTQLLSAASMVIALPGLSLLFLGATRTRAILFPLALTAFALPIPLALTEPVHMVLRQIATAACATVLPLIGVPVFAEGTTLNLASTAVQISDACSGFSTLYASVALAYLTAYTTPGWGRKLLILAAAAPLAIAANVVRVILLVLMVVWQGPEILDTFIHPLSGMLTFAVALPVIFWLGQPAKTPERITA